MAIRYSYKNAKYTSLYSLRQAIWDADKLCFGETLTDDLKDALCIVEEQYTPIDEMSDEEVAQRVRYKRDALIAKSDFYVQLDYPSTPEGLVAVKAYRQTLRDIPEQSGFPRNVQWPSLPSVLSRAKGLATVGLAKVGV